MRTRTVAILALLLTWVFFFEYRPPHRKVYIPYDLDGFHYSLADYAFQSIRHGRLPEWDPTEYSGLPFAANTQAQLFYPPAWALFAANATHDRLHYTSLEDFVFLHIWLAFVLCYAWLKSRGLHPLACGLGAGVFACSGYMMTQMQHLGLVTGFAWWPLGFWAIDRAARSGRWRPSGWLAASSALVFLAGYTPLWVVFGVCMTAYAAGQPRPLRAMAATAVSIACSVPLVAIQLLPAIEASAQMVRESRFGAGVREPAFFWTFLIPNFYDFGLKVPAGTHPGFDYWYLSAAGIVGVVWMLASRRFREAAPALAVAAVTAIFVLDPFGLLFSVLYPPSIFSQVIRSWYFMAGFTASAALISAIGMNHAFKSKIRPIPAWGAWAAIAGALVWCVRLMAGWRSEGAGFSSGIHGIYDSAAAILLCAALVTAFASSKRGHRTIIGCALALLTFTEFKAFGTSKRFNAATASATAGFASQPFPGLDEDVYREMLSNPASRVALDSTGPLPASLRHVGLATPQGFDPLLPTRYRTLAESSGRFLTDREFLLDDSNQEALSLLGVRYFLTLEQGPSDPARFRLMPGKSGYYHATEVRQSPPAYGWEGPGVPAPVQLVAWLPERRAFQVSAPAAGRFRLSEQYYPGWSATIDGNAASIQPCHSALQCIDVPAGNHLVEFRFRSGSLRLGALISLVSILLLGAVSLLTSK